MSRAWLEFLPQIYLAPDCQRKKLMIDTATRDEVERVLQATAVQAGLLPNLNHLNDGEKLHVRYRHCTQPVIKRGGKRML